MNFCPAVSRSGDNFPLISLTQLNHSQVNHENLEQKEIHT